MVFGINWVRKMGILRENNKKALYIDNSTLFLLGNGCSMEYGFPSGDNLLVEGFNIIQKYTYDTNSLLQGKAFGIYQSLESLLSSLSDLHKKVLVGNLEFLHVPEYLYRLITAHEPNLCSCREECPYACHDKTLSEIGFEISKEKYESCKKIREILDQNKIWKLFPELTEKYQDNETYGQGCVDWKKKSITDIYDSLANLTVSILFFFYEQAKKNIKVDPYLDFCQKLKRYQGNIINLNYDLLFEDAKKQCNVASFKIYKPHGSFDLVYYTREPRDYWNCARIRQNVYQLLEEKNINEFYQGRYLVKNPLCVAYSNINTHQSISQTKQARFVKEYTIPMLQQLKREMSSFNKVVSIGYSFSVDTTGNQFIDHHIIELFRGKDLYIVGKGNTSPIARIVRKIMPNIQAHPTDFDGFSDYVKQIK